MIPRYSHPEMAGLWTDEAKYASWVRVELLACEAQAELGVLSPAELAEIRTGRVPTPQRVAELEKDRDHEILAFLAAYTETIDGRAARWVHHGMTSYDLVDTALGHTLAQACDLVLAAGRQLRDVLARRALEHWDTVCVARTHGIHAEPTTFGHKLAVHALAVHRTLERLGAARTKVAVGTISGAVGTYAQIDPFVERYVCERLGLGCEPVPTQVVARDRHADLVSTLALFGAVVEQVALELRLLQRTEVREVEEPRTAGYQGSSAMPHKRNPTSSERLCGLARVLRANASAVLENVALWHERDLAHSSVERIVFPDSFQALHYQLRSATEVIEGLRVFPDRMRRNLDATNGLIYSSVVMLDLVAAGTDRESAYRTVQAAATETWESERPLIETLQERGIAVQPEQFDPRRFLTQNSLLRERLEEIIHVEV
ncbi:adenylosuccinate lyase [Actinoplanes sp. NPDC051346]|uniref:adenylosuccinate lyase n=1 Tax=Actinoplanes sp. NPDC051346 TaxID=3155048 RepID=UPI00343E40D9